MAWFDRSPGEKKKSPVEERPNLMSSPVTAKREEVPVESPSGELVAYLYKGSRVAGQLTFHGPARIDGNVEGEVSCQDVLTIGQEADVRAKISGKVIVIRGRVEGDVVAKEKVELMAPARLFGNIYAPRLIVSEGVVFDGYCSMGGVRQKGEVLSPLSSRSEKALESEAPKLITDMEK